MTELFHLPRNMSGDGWLNHCSCCAILMAMKLTEKQFSVSMSREDIAHLSNMTTSNAIRTLSTMASEEIIEITGRKISILDPDLLEHISEAG